MRGKTQDEAKAVYVDLVVKVILFFYSFFFSFPQQPYRPIVCLGSNLFSPCALSVFLHPVLNLSVDQERPKLTRTLFFPAYSTKHTNSR